MDKNEFNEVLSEIRMTLHNYFPNLQIFGDYDDEDDMFQIIINDVEVYMSDRYLRIINDYFDKVLKPKRLTNVVFLCDIDKQATNTIKNVITSNLANDYLESINEDTEQPDFNNLSEANEKIVMAA